MRAVFGSLRAPTRERTGATGSLMNTEGNEGNEEEAGQTERANRLENVIHWRLEGLRYGRFESCAAVCITGENRIRTWQTRIAPVFTNQYRRKRRHEEMWSAECGVRREVRDSAFGWDLLWAELRVKRSIGEWACVGGLWHFRCAPAALLRRLDKQPRRREDFQGKIT